MSDNNQKNLHVDPDLCIGCGLCVTTCSDTFQLGDDGKAFVKDPAGCAKCDCRQAIDDCPSHAISSVEENPKS